MCVGHGFVNQCQFFFFLLESSSLVLFINGTLANWCGLCLIGIAACVAH